MIVKSVCNILHFGFNHPPLVDAFLLYDVHDSIKITEIVCLSSVFC
jgi:hypothetical protein